jgi:hypothetical protein
MSSILEAIIRRKGKREREKEANTSLETMERRKRKALEKSEWVR